ncbi:MAG: hypothetical protein RR635_07645, partial [Oscillospiraceae bacterium]
LVEKGASQDIADADFVLEYDIPENAISKELVAYINGLIFSQMLSVEKSLEREITTDNPCPKGEVNRVVKGVVIYEL